MPTPRCCLYDLRHGPRLLFLCAGFDQLFDRVCPCWVWSSQLSLSPTSRYEGGRAWRRRRRRGSKESRASGREGAGWTAGAGGKLSGTRQRWPGRGGAGKKTPENSPPTLFSTPSIAQRSKSSVASSYDEAWKICLSRSISSFSSPVPDTQPAGCRWEKGSGS